MECVTKIKDSAEVLMDYGSGALSAARVAEVDRHIEDCEACRQLFAAQRALWLEMDQLAAPEVSGNFDARLYARIAEEDAAPAWRRWTRRLFAPAVPVAIWKPAVSLAAACAVLTVGLMVRTPGASEKVQQQVRADHAVDIEQVADALDDLEMLSPGSAM